MAFSESEVQNDKACTKSCLKNYETLKKQYDDLLAKLHQTEFKASTYKRGLDTVEAQLVTYRKNEVLFSKEVAVLKREVGCKTYEFNMLKTEFEKVKQEKEGIDFKIEKFENALKYLDKLLGSQITDNSKTGLGYHAVLPPHPLIYNAPTKLNLSQSPRGNQRIWNNQKSQQLGSDFVMIKKACYLNQLVLLVVNLVLLVSTESDSNDETTHVHGSMVESSKKKELKKFDFVTESGEHVYLTKEHISAQKKIEEEAKAKAARREGEMRKKELIDLIGPEVVNKYYNDKLHYDRYNDKMLNRRAKSRITNYDILTRKGQITLKVYREDDTSEIIPEFKANNLHLAELGIDLDRSLSEQDPLDRLNDLENKKRKHADDIHDFFRANKRLKSPVQYKDHPAGTVLNEPVL
ncbi:hypothetical protein Tco_0435448, partial [Tanacetum coccineum]